MMANLNKTVKVSYSLWKSLWSVINLVPPSRPGPCWCNYGELEHDNNNSPVDDIQHHGFCIVNRRKFRESLIKKI